MRIAVWKHDPDEDRLVDTFELEEPLDLDRAVAAWAAGRGTPVIERVHVWCRRRGVLMTFHCTNESSAGEARQLVTGEEFAEMFSRPTSAQIDRCRNDFACADHHLDDLQFKPQPPSA